MARAHSTKYIHTRPTDVLKSVPSEVQICPRETKGLFLFGMYIFLFFKSQAVIASCVSLPAIKYILSFAPLSLVEVLLSIELRSVQW